MNVWIDLANSPHVVLFRPVVERLRGQGARVALTARDHAQTVELACATWDDVTIIGGESPAGVVPKGAALSRRILRLARFARDFRPSVALSHGSYAQIVAARLVGVPVVTMMDYEFQPANHLSFRAAERVIVPLYFLRPSQAIRRAADEGHALRGFQGGAVPGRLQAHARGARRARARSVPDEIFVVVFRPPPDGALYHRHANERFETLVDMPSPARLRLSCCRAGKAQRQRWAERSDVTVPLSAIDGLSLLATETHCSRRGRRDNEPRGRSPWTPTYSIFTGRLAAVDCRAHAGPVGCTIYARRDFRSMRRKRRTIRVFSGPTRIRSFPRSSQR